MLILRLFSLKKNQKKKKKKKKKTTKKTKQNKTKKQQQPKKKTKQKKKQQQQQQKTDKKLTLHHMGTIFITGHPRCRIRVSRYYHSCRSDVSFPTFFLYISLHFNSVYVENG